MTEEDYNGTAQDIAAPGCYSWAASRVDVRDLSVLTVAKDVSRRETEQQIARGGQPAVEPNDTPRAMSSP